MKLNFNVQNKTQPDPFIFDDGDKLYIILSVYYYEGQTAYTDFDLIVGKLPYNNDSLSKEFLTKIYNKYLKKLQALKNADRECTELEKLVGELKQWQQ